MQPYTAGFGEIGEIYLDATRAQRKPRLIWLDDVKHCQSWTLMKLSEDLYQWKACTVPLSSSEQENDRLLK